MSEFLVTVKMLSDEFLSLLLLRTSNSTVSAMQFHHRTASVVPVSYYSLMSKAVQPLISLKVQSADA